MADDRKTWRKNIPADFDGRFGEKFDDEISVKSVVQVAAGVAITCAVTFVFTWGMLLWNDKRAEAAKPPPSAVVEANEVQAPPGPQLQAHPEQEMEALRHQMQAKLNGYGWVDEIAGTVHIPVEQAMAMLLERAGSTASDSSGAMLGEGTSADSMPGVQGDSVQGDTGEAGEATPSTEGEGGHR